jgi:hypothetical protein
MRSFSDEIATKSDLTHKHNWVTIIDIATECMLRALLIVTLVLGGYYEYTQLPPNTQEQQ